MRLDYNVTVDNTNSDRVTELFIATHNAILEMKNDFRYLNTRLDLYQQQLMDARNLIERHKIFKEKLIIAIEANRPYSDFLKILSEIE